jgi:HlyD family secretion protein
VDELSSDLASLKIDRSPPAERNGSWIKWVVILAVLGGLGVAGVSLYPHLEAQVFKTEVKTGVITDVSPSLAVTSLTATGYVVAERRSKVGSSVLGRIAAVHVKEGSDVKKGDVLVELDAADHRSSVAAQQARVAAAEARVAASRAQLAETEVQLARQKDLASQNAAARSVVEDLEARAGTLRAQVSSALAEAKSAQADVALARVTLDRTSIEAPMDGTVLDKPLDVGETVSTETPILELADLRSVVVEIDVPETRLSLVKVGGPCEITLDAFADKKLRGKVRELGKRVNRAKATVPVKVEFTDDASGVLPDMSARVSFLSEELDAKTLAGPSKVVLPQRAVARRGERAVVFVVDGGKVLERPVTLGAATADGVELVDGPPVGTRVVLDPPSTLAEGQKVKERSE